MPPSLSLSLSLSLYPSLYPSLSLSHLSLFFSMLCSLTLDLSVPLSSSLSSSLNSFLSTSLSSSLYSSLSSSLSSSLPASLSPLVPLPFYPLFPSLCMSHRPKRPPCWACRREVDVPHSASSKPTTEFAQTRLSRVNLTKRGHPQRWGYKLGCVCSYMAGHDPGILMTGHFRNKGTQNLYRLAGDDRALPLLKQGCANSGGFGARCLISWERTQKKQTHINLFGGVLVSSKGSQTGHVGPRKV